MTVCKNTRRVMSAGARSHQQRISTHADTLLHQSCPCWRSPGFATSLFCEEGLVEARVLVHRVPGVAASLHPAAVHHSA